VSTKDNIVVLDQTYFYPEGGGQEPDYGVIGGSRVNDVQKSGHSVLHFIEGPLNFTVGQEVECEIDWNRRMNMMRNHTATHLVLAVARRILGPHVWQAGAHKSEGVGRLDITHYDSLKPEEKEKIEREVNDIVLADITLRKSFISREQAERRFGFKLYQGGAVPGAEVRVVEIPDLDVEACGGTHCDRTGEIGPFKILRTKRIQDGIVRLEYAAGKPAVDEIQKQSETIRTIAETLGTSPEQVGDAVKRLCEEWKEQRKEIERLNKEKMTLLAKGLSEEVGTAKEDEVGGVKIYTRIISGEAKDLITLTKELLKNGKAIAILGAEGETANISIGRSEDVDLDVREIITEGVKIIGGKGGGKSDFAQGGGPEVEAVKDAVEKMREETLSRLKSGVS